MLAKHFQVAHEWDDFDFDPSLMPLKRLSARQVGYLAKAHFQFKDDDLRSWPFRMWFLAHRQQTIFHSIHQPFNAVARRYGYVIWDSTRGMSDMEIRTHLANMRATSEEEEQDRQSKIKPMQDSWAARRLLYDQQMASEGKDEEGSASASNLPCQSSERE